MQGAQTLLPAQGQLPQLSFGQANDGVAERQRGGLLGSEGNEVGRGSARAAIGYDR